MASVARVGAYCRHLRPMSTAAGMPQLHLGTMTFGWAKNTSSLCDDAVASEMMQAFAGKGGVHFDTARIYADGETERIIGRVFDPSGTRNKFRVATKAHPSQPGGLSDKGIRDQLQASLSAMGEQRVDVLYLHQPDTNCDLTESLATCDALVKEGLVGSIGLSNYSAVETDRLVQLCQSNGWVQPAVFQGLYNPLNRRVEEQLLPVLRKHNIAFIAFNPLAAGLLTGKHTKDGEVPPGRFKDNGNYLPRFYTDPNFQALDLIREACAAHGVSLVEATYAWLMHHSVLSGSEDGILLGASSMAQLEENMSACQGSKPLHADVVTAFEKAWAITAPEAFAYWRSYSKDHPDRDALDQGASYNAKKS